MALLGDGKMVVVGSSYNGSNDDFALVCYNEDGTVDTTFGIEGKVTTAIGSHHDGGHSVAVDSNGKIVVAGYSIRKVDDDWFADFALVRYHANGSLDTDFGVQGIVTTAIGIGSGVNHNSVALQGDGKIVVAGSSSDGINEDFTLLRYTADGTLDADFGVGGIVTTAISIGNDASIGMALQSDGKIVVTGFAENGIYRDFALVRYDTEGDLDTTFGGDGIVITDFGGDALGYSVAVDSNGKIVVAGGANIDQSITPVLDFALARYNEDGSLDTSFGGGDGKVTTPIGGISVAASVAVQGDGRIVAAGASFNFFGASDFALARYDADGTLDMNFGARGILTTALGDAPDGAYSVAVQSDGGIVAAGFAQNANGISQFALVRYEGTEGPDTVVPDTKAPVVTVIAPPARSATSEFTISGTVKENSALASFKVKLNGVEVALDAPLSFVGNANVAWSASILLENGSNLIEVEAVDRAGRSAKVTKMVTYVNTRPALAGTYTAVLVPVGTPGVHTTGLVTVTVTATGAFTGKARLSGASVPIIGVLKNDGAARFNATRFKPELGASFVLIDKTEFNTYLGALALSVSESDGMSGTLSTQASGGEVLANFAGKVAPYSTTNLVEAGLLNQPITGTATKGVYTVVFPSKAQEPALEASAYPQGDGYATLRLTNTGNVTLAGYLADGTKYTAIGKLRSDGTVALCTQLYKKLGVMVGELTFANETNSDVSGADLLWIRPAHSRAQYYRSGWEDGIRVDAVGAKYAASRALNFGQSAANLGNGNATLVFADGLLASPVSKALSVDPTTGAVKRIPATNTSCTLIPTAVTGVLTGVFTGTFTHDGVTDSYRGILLNKGANQGGFGYFLSTPALSYGATGQSGGVSLSAN